MALVITEGMLNPSFTVEQRRILRKLAELVYNTTVAEMPTVLNDLTDVDAVATTSNNALIYNLSTELWEEGYPYTRVTTNANTSITLALSDSNTFLCTTASSAVTITIPPQVDVAWNDNTQIEINQRGTGQVTVVAGSGVTLTKPSYFDAATRERYSAIGLKRISSNVWTLFGDLQ